jgi:ketosteroid isomerase-like protein
VAWPEDWPIVSLSPTVEPLFIAAIAMFVVLPFFPAIWVLRQLQARRSPDSLVSRHPLISLSGLVFVFGFAFDFAMEELCVRIGLYTFTQVIPFGSVFVGTRWQFPLLWQSSLIGILMVRDRHEGETAMGDDDVRAALRRHWAASDANDFATEHQIYRDDAVLEYPQSGERIRGRASIQASRAAQPNTKRFTVRRVLGGGDLWISELVLTYDGQPYYVVSIMEFEGGEVVRETQYFGDPFEPGASRAQWVERMD